MSWDEIIKGTNGSDIINGGSGDDFIQGRAGGDFLDGGDGNDQIQGNEGDDYIRGGAGNDFIHGGSGTDTAVYSGSVKDYTYNRNGEEFFLNHVGGSMIDGHDRLISIERLIFADAVIDLTQNNAPIAFNDTASTDEDNSVSGNVLANDFDWEGDSMTATPGTFNGVYGTLTLNAGGSYTYTPYGSTQALAQGQTVTDTFTYTVSDGSLSDTGTLTVTIAGVNDAPVANPDVAATGENSPVSIDVLANDTDVDNGAILTVVAASAPAGQGSASIVANQVVFDPGTDFDYLDDGETAQVVVSYTISDEHGATSSSTVTVTVNGANDAPVANDDTASTSEDAAVAGNVLANDADVDGETLTVANPGTYVGAYGTLTLAADGSYTYTPNAAAQGLDDGESAQDVFSYTASDGTASDSATLTVTVGGANDAPVANDDSDSTNEDSAGVSGNVLANDTDVDGETLSVANPGTYVGTYGTLTLAADGSYTYTPGAGAQALDVGESAQDVFAYVATDGTASDAANLTVTVTGLNDAPVANDDTAATDENSPVSGNVLANDTDVDGEALTVANAGTFIGAYGTLVLAANGSYTYTPGAGAAALTNGQTADDVFTYIASDGTVSDAATLTVTVTGLSGVPDAVDDTAATNEDDNVSGNVLANDTDPENDPLTVSDPGTYVGTYGTLTLSANGNYTYTPGAAADGLAAGESAQDVFTYTATDGGASDTATLTVTVNGLNDAPTIDAGGTDSSGSVTELPDDDPGEDVTIHADSGAVAFDDVDVSDTHSASFTPQGAFYLGTFSLDPVDQVGDSVGWDFTVSDAALEGLSEGEVRIQTYTIEIDDGNGGTATQDVTITITGAGVGVGPQTVWYIDNSAVGSANLGTEDDPFTSIASFNAAQGALGGPQAGHTVYLLAGTGVYAEADGINLLNDQILIGVPDGAVRPTIEAAAGDGINVAQGNNISGLDIGNTSGADIADSGGSVGNLTVSDVGSSGLGQIVDIDQGGNLNVTLNSAESLGSSGGAVDLAGVGGSFTVAGATTIAGVHSGGGIDITGSSVAASFAGGGDIATLDTAAVNYVGNSGTLALDGGFAIVTTSGAGLNASGGGTVTVTGAGNSIISTTGTALSVVNSDIGAAGLTFESISSSGAVNGIVLNTTGADGGLTVTGDAGSAANGSGGTIAGSTGAGILLTNTRDTSLDQLNVQNGLDDGIRGNNVTNFTLTNATVAANGDGLQEHGAEFTNLLGTGTFTDVAFSNNEASQVSIVNTTSTANLAFTGVTMSSTGVAAAPNGLHGLSVSTSGTASADLLVVDSAFDNLFSNSVNAVNSGSGTLEVEIAATDFTNVGASAINIVQSGSGTVRFNIHDNDTFLRGTNSGISHSININQASTAPAGSVLEGAISNNTIGDNSSSTSATSGGDGIRVFSVGAGTTNVQIDGNDVQGVGGNGINVQMSGSANPAHTMNVTLFDNEVTLTDVNSFDAIRVVAGASTGNAGILRLDMHDNVASAAVGDDFEVRQRFATTVELLDYAGAPTDTTAVQNYFDNDRGNDAIGAGNDWFITTQAPGGGFVGTASVPAPVLPIIGDLPLL